MIKADKYYIENLKRILEENNKDREARPKYKDGVEANSLFITQVFEEYANGGLEILQSELRGVVDYQIQFLLILKKAIDYQENNIEEEFNLTRF